MRLVKSALYLIRKCGVCANSFQDLLVGRQGLVTNVNVRTKFDEQIDSQEHKNLFEFFRAGFHKFSKYSTQYKRYRVRKSFYVVSMNFQDLFNNVILELSRMIDDC